MTGFAPKRREIMHRLREDLEAWQGYQCGMPSCINSWSDVAHIQGSGMGGRISTYSIENVVGLCRSCHDIFDGHVPQGRQAMLRDLLAAHVKNTRDRSGLRKLQSS